MRGKKKEPKTFVQTLGNFRFKVEWLGLHPDVSGYQKGYERDTRLLVWKGL